VQTDQFLSQLIQLSQLRLKREQPRHAPPKKTEHYAYATAAKGYGYRMALMGFDFTDLEEKRRKFQWWLESQGVDSDTAYSEATRLDHSWEFAAHKQGKDYMNSLDPWLGALDMTPGSVGLKLYDKYREVRGRNIFLPTDTTYDVQRTAQRNHTAAESRTDFAAIKAIYDTDAVTLANKLRAYIAEARDSLVNLVERQAQSGPLSAEFAQSIKVSTGPEFAKDVEAFLMDVWRRNRDAAIAELPERIKGKLLTMKKYAENRQNLIDAGDEDGIGYLEEEYQRELGHNKDYAVAFRPDVAGNYFHNRALLIRGIVDDELTRDAKFSIFETLKGGRTMNEAMGDLRSIFEPWIGDPTKIEPSGISDTEEDILKPYRLENIVRTESTTAVAQGRAAVADAAADYVVGFQHSSILDFRTTEVCQLADGITFKKDDPRAVKLQPPLHFNCRSIDTFVTSDDEVEWTSEEDLDAVVRLIQPEFK